MTAFASSAGWGKIAEIDWSIRPRLVRDFADLQTALNDGPGPVIVQKGGNWTNPDGFTDIHGGTLLFFEPSSGGTLLRTVFRAQGNEGDAIIRNANFAPGILANVPDVATDAAQNGDGWQRIIYDYCRFMFSRDEVFSSGFGCDYVTCMRSILAWALHDTGRADGELHSKAGMFHHTGVGHGTIWLSALLHNYDRNYRCVGGGLYELINNLVFDWETGIYVSNGTAGGRTMLHVIGNNYLPHPTNKKAIGGMRGQNWLVYLNDNQGNFTGLDAANMSTAPLFESQVPEELIRPSSEITAELLNEIGPKNHDALWERLISDVRTLHRGIIDSPDEVGGYPVITPLPVLDSDDDGVPDGFDLAVEDYVEAVLTDTLPTPDIEPPFIQIILPRENANVGKRVVIAGICSDNTNVQRIVLTAPMLTHTIVEPLHSWSWTWNIPAGVPNGEAFIKAEAFDDSGNLTTMMRRIIIRRFQEV